MIPKIMHQIWYQGEGKIPTKLKDYRANCKKINKAYKQYIWDGETIERFIEDNYPQYADVYKSFPMMIQKIDFAKYLILHFYGGVYVDMDVVCMKEVEKMIYLFDGNEMMVVPAPKEIPFDMYNKLTKMLFKFEVTETDRYINNGTIIAKKNHGFFLFLCDEIARLIKTYKYNMITKYITSDGYVWVSTGPGIFTKCIFNYRKKNRENIEIIDEKYMEPCSEVSEDCNLSDAYFNHMHERSWVGLGEVFVKLQKVFNFLKKYVYYVILILLMILLTLFVYFHNNKKQWLKTINWTKLQWKIFKKNREKNARDLKNVSKLANLNNIKNGMKNIDLKKIGKLPKK